MTCRLGFLYTKENLITSLLDKTLHSNFSHIKGLKHVKELVLTPNSEHSSDSSAGGGDSVSAGKEDSELASRFMCPVTQLPLNGLYNFVAIWPTGHVLSEKAIREIGVEGLQLEYGPFAAADVVALLPAEEELNTRRATLQAQAEVAKKKAKEEKKRGREKQSQCPPAPGSEAGSGSGGGERVSKSSRKHGAKTTSSSSIIGGGGGTLGGSRGIAQEARSSVAGARGKSEGFDQLFSRQQKPGEQQKPQSGSDLFFSVAGIRYTL